MSQSVRAARKGSWSDGLQLLKNSLLIKPVVKVENNIGDQLPEFNNYTEICFHLYK